MTQHVSVMLTEAIKFLQLRANGYYIDGTFGRGGHSREIIKSLNADGHLFAFDKDITAINHGAQVFANEQRITLINDSFISINQFITAKKLVNNIDGILLDLGVSNPQLQEGNRGFSFTIDGPLDMRMDQSTGITAAKWLNTASISEIKHVLWSYGEEKNSYKIAKAIVAARIDTPFNNTKQLSDLCSQINTNYREKKHPATRVFQAIRIHINQELEDLKIGLEEAFKVLAPMGRLVVISFHSLEDRIVKKFMHSKVVDNLPPKLPVLQSEVKILGKIVAKKIKPSLREINDNPQARSAIMRVLEKIA